MERYPQLVIATKNLQHNFNCLKEMCRPYGIRITAVTKGFTSVPEACQALWECHPRAIATSRIDQAKKIKEYDPSITTELLRIPALSECDLVVKYADISLNSELSVLQKLNEEALKQGKIHRVILMKDIGDRREGFESEDVMIDAASMVEYGMPGLKLYGIGANFGCYGSICVSKDKVDWLADIMEKIEAKIGRQLDVLSIGGTQSFHNMAQGELNPRVNDIRAGISLITKAEYTWKEDFPERVDAFRIRAEIVELKKWISACASGPSWPSASRISAAPRKGLRPWIRRSRSGGPAPTTPCWTWRTATGTISWGTSWNSVPTTW